MLRRKVYDDLVRWKNRKHNCLLIKGQRQIGKTFIIREFANNNYKEIVEINFHENTEAHEAFESNLDVNTIISRLSIILDKTITPENTLLFFDEIQDCPKARSSLKSFSQDKRYDVIASGSLLGVEDSRLYKRKYRKNEELPPLLPVGYEEHITMHGLDFEEFLWALGYDDEMTDRIREMISDKKPLGPAIVNGLMSRFREFMGVGGMPQCVNDYIIRRNPRDTDESMSSIIDTIVGDINRYNDEKESTKTLACFRSIENQLSDTNKRFMLSRIDSRDKVRACMDSYRENLLWIMYSGIGNFCYSLDQPAKPVEGNVNPDVFKVYLSDTGMLTHLYGNPARLAIMRNDAGFNQGALMENIVAECLMKSEMKPRYYRKTNGKGQMELDFVLELGPDLTVIEVKSGKSRNAASLKKVCDFFNIDRRILLEDGDIRIDEDGIEHYPLFCAAFLNELVDPEYRKIVEGEGPWIDVDDSVVKDLLSRKG